MKTLLKTISASALVLAIAAPASAMVSPNIKQDVLFAAGSNSNVSVIVEGDTVTLTGYVEDAYARTLVAQAAKADGVRVINNVFHTN